MCDVCEETRREMGGDAGRREHVLRPSDSDPARYVCVCGLELWVPRDMVPACRGARPTLGEAAIETTIEQWGIAIDAPPGSALQTFLEERVGLARGRQMRRVVCPGCYEQTPPHRCEGSCECRVCGPDLSPMELFVAGWNLRHLRWMRFWGEVAAACLVARDGGFFVCHACPDDPEPHIHRWEGVRWIEPNVLKDPTLLAGAGKKAGKVIHIEPLDLDALAPMPDEGGLRRLWEAAGMTKPRVSCPATPPHDGCVLCRGSGYVEAL